MTENSKELLERLSTEICEAKWELLDNHHKRQSLFIVSDSLELVAVGVAMARDQVEYIRNWLNDGLIDKPTDDLIKTWLESDVTFNYLIIQPYVIIQIPQPKPADEE